MAIKSILDIFYYNIGEFENISSMVNLKESIVACDKQLKDALNKKRYELVCQLVNFVADFYALECDRQFSTGFTIGLNKSIE